jgi:hypothetical protein
MFLNGSLKKLTNTVLDKFIDHHSLRKCSNKKERLNAIAKKVQELSQQFIDEDDEDENGESESSDVSDSDRENPEEFILDEIGISDLEEDSHEVDENPEVFLVYTRSGRMATRLQCF